MYKYLFLICFGIIIFMLLNDIDTFNIGSHIKNRKSYIITNCKSDRNEVENYWTEGYKTSNNIHYIDIKTSDDNDKTYKLSVVLSSKVVEFMKYSSDFTSKNDINFATNLCRLLKKIQFIVKEMCKNLDEIYIRNIATISEDSDGIIDFLNPLNTDLNNIRCIYIYYDKTISDNAVNYLNANPSPLPNVYVQYQESPCNFCPYHNFFGITSAYSGDDRQLCEDTMSFESGERGNLVISLSDVYYFNQIDENLHTSYSNLVHEFAHDILENGIVNSNYDERAEFNDIYERYVEMINNNNELNCSEIYACYGSLSGNGRELFAMASETWFGFPAIYNNPYIDSIDNISSHLSSLYDYLVSVYGLPNPLCKNKLFGGICTEDSFNIPSTYIPLSILATASILGAIGYGVKKCAAIPDKDYNELTCGDIPGEV